MRAAELRQAILQAAVQGKLVPQSSHDEPVTELLKRIQQEKARLVKERKIKKEKPLSPIIEDEIPFDLPDGWIWRRFAQITNIDSNLVDPLGYLNYPHIAPDNIEKYTGNLLPFRTVQEDEVKSNNHYFTCGQILYSKIRPALRKAVIIPFNGLCSADMYPLDTYVEAQFLLYYILSDIFTFQVLKNETRVKMPKTNQEELSKVVVPIPPLAEQQRIVARVKELMALCDELEAAEKELDALEHRLTEYLPKSILQAAVQGKLVPQDPNDEPATELLKRIQQKKTRLVKEGKIKKEKPLPPITEDEIPYDLPDGWVWCRLGELTYNHGQIIPQKEFSYIDIGSIDNTKQQLNQTETILSAKQAPSRARKIVEQGDILYATVRPYLHNMCIVNKPFTRRPIASTGFAVMACYYGINNRYLFYYLLSPDFDDYANDKGNAKGIAYPAINDTKLYNAYIPLPPLAEQQRIVAKVDELMAMYGELNSARTLAVESMPSSVVPFPHKTAIDNEDEEIAMAARGDATSGLSEQALRDVAELFGDEVDE